MGSTELGAMLQAPRWPQDASWVCSQHLHLSLGSSLPKVCKAAGGEVSSIVQMPIDRDADRHSSLSGPPWLPADRAAAQPRASWKPCCHCFRTKYLGPAAWPGVTVTQWLIRPRSTASAVHVRPQPGLALALLPLTWVCTHPEPFEVAR